MDNTDLQQLLDNLIRERDVIETLPPNHYNAARLLRLDDQITALRQRIAGVL